MVKIRRQRNFHSPPLPLLFPEGSRSTLRQPAALLRMCKFVQVLRIRYLPYLHFRLDFR